MNRYAKDSPLDPKNEENSLLGQAAKRLGITLEEAEWNREKILDPEEQGKLEGMMDIKRLDDLRKRSKGRAMAEWQASGGGLGLG